MGRPHRSDAHLIPFVHPEKGKQSLTLTSRLPFLYYYPLRVSPDERAKKRQGGERVFSGRLYAATFSDVLVRAGSVALSVARTPAGVSARWSQANSPSVSSASATMPSAPAVACA